MILKIVWLARFVVANIFPSYLEFLYSVVLLKCLSFNFFHIKGDRKYRTNLTPVNRSSNKTNLRSLIDFCHYYRGFSQWNVLPKNWLMNHSICRPEAAELQIRLNCKIKYNECFFKFFQNEPELIRCARHSEKYSDISIFVCWLDCFQNYNLPVKVLFL